MTTLVWDGKAVYADSQCTYDDRKGVATKVFKVRTPTGRAVVAFCGDLSIREAVCACVGRGESPAPLVQDNSSVLVWSHTGVMLYCDGKGWPEEGPIFLGSGANWAQATYDLTGDGKRAVAMACKYDLYSGYPITTTRL